ncbi:ScbR family autoregulator-binding transcription factor [Streptomyces griseoloalbus]|uniref:AcrR family transcriptional regulator n=1 Tax=Streptomyces griseoloalbus TaxID=67303 RepID=A0A7W8BSF9_9ACTN|nr:ScbR family autoregulator-binding transcription factor [Streptomyces albaduncus]MBB5128767.1 AcrR family transcriptional regulator [Streptomyces albaduncus]GGV73789.1 TetR family transcriptional regulator [Streptomyces griseoloalbus]
MAKQDRAVRTRQELICSAAEVFDRRGFMSASLADISTGAGVSTGALNFHFSSKKELGETVQAAAEESLRYITTACTEARPSPLQTLIDATHVLATQFGENVVLRAGLGLDNDAAWDGGADLWLKWRSWVRGMLTIAEYEGNLAAGVLPDDACATIMAIVMGLESLGRKDAALSSRRVVTRFWKMVLPGLASEETRAKVDAAGSEVVARWDEQVRTEGGVMGRLAVARCDTCTEER